MSARPSSVPTFYPFIIGYIKAAQVHRLLCDVLEITATFLFYEVVPLASQVCSSIQMLTRLRTLFKLKNVFDTWGAESARNEGLGQRCRVWVCGVAV